MGYAEIIQKNSQESPVKWWSRYAFHYTDVINAVGILSLGSLYSRIYASETKLMQNDNASIQVINMTESAAVSSVRFYFRPLTPTQYYNEGFKHKDIRYDGDDNANVPVPIFLLFDLEKLLNHPDISFSQLSQAGFGSPIYQGEEAFAKLDFKKIYSKGYADAEIRKYRHAEILCPDAYAIDDSMSVILCRNDIEKTTLMTLLKKKNPKAYYKYKDIIKTCKSDMFENNGLFLKDISFGKSVISFSFADSHNKKSYEISQMHRYGLTVLDPVSMEFIFRWIDSAGSIIAEHKLEHYTDYQNPMNVFIKEIPEYKKAKSIEVSLFVEGKIMACVEHLINDSVF